MHGRNDTAVLMMILKNAIKPSHPSSQRTEDSEIESSTFHPQLFPDLEGAI